MNIVSQIFNAERISQLSSIIALQWSTGSWTYSELRNSIQQASDVLQSRGIKPNDHVVLQCSDTPNFVAFYFAVLNIGAVAIAVSSRLNGEELEFVINDSNSFCLVYDSTTEKSCKRILNQNDSGLIGIHVEGFSLNQEFRQDLQTVSRSNVDEALWVYSSGSTSRPKAIVHTHQDFAICCEFHSNTLKLQVGEKIFCTSKSSFAYTLANALLVPLRLGATIHLHPDWMTADAVLKILNKEKPKVLFSVPSLYRGLLERMETSEKNEFSSTEFFVSAGEHLPADIRREWKKRTGKSVINAYGCSETLFLAFAGDHLNTPDNSVGRPLFGVEPMLVNGNEILPIDSGEKAVLHVNHPYLFSCYANREKDTAERLVDQYFVTGDLYRRDAQGWWYHMGREDELIKVSGQWVYLRDIEKSGLRSDVAFDVSVVSTKDDAGMVRPAMFFVPIGGIKAQAALSEMKNHIQRELPKIKRPSWIRVLDAFPRTANGKISRYELQQMVQGTKRD